MSKQGILRWGILPVMLLALVFIGFAAGGAGAVSADGSEDVDVTWDGGGYLGIQVDTGDASTLFETDGAYTNGHFVATDSNDNPYGYGVDSYSTYMNGGVTNGYMEYTTDRLDSKTSAYGSAGQQSYGFVGVNDGTGEIATGSGTNYAAQKDCLYGHSRTSNGHHFEANAGAFTIIKSILAGDGDWSQVRTDGSGLAQLDCMNSEISGGQASLGRGCGCYVNADFHAAGSGNFLAEAHGNNYAEIYATGDSSWGDTASVGIIAAWTNGGCDIDDYSMYAN